MNIIGTCSLCGGPVGHEAIYMSVIPMVPRCQRCGATKKQPFGPVIEMEPAKEKRFADIGEPPSEQAIRDACAKMQLELGNRKPSRTEQLIQAGVDPQAAAQIERDERLGLRGDRFRSPYTEDQTGVARARSFIHGEWKLSDD